MTHPSVKRRYARPSDLLWIHIRTEPSSDFHNYEKIFWFYLSCCPLAKNILLQSFLALLSFKYFIFVSTNESASFDWALFLNSNLEPDKILTSALHSFREINLESFGLRGKGISQVSADGSARRKNFWKFLNFLKSGQRRARERNHGISYLSHFLTVMTFCQSYNPSVWLIGMTH